ncbi:MAG: Ppx/GppA phosphatase family protein, partial [Eubacteriales bacterium]
SGDTAVVDVGGGSTELVWPAPGGLICRSANAGAVRMSVSNAGEAEIAEAIELILSGARRDGVRNLIGVGGTITTCAAIDLGLVHYSPAKTHGYVLTAGIIKKILSKLKGLEAEARKKVPGLQPERADIIVAGVTIVKLVLKGLGLDRLRVSESDILQGLVLEEVEKLSGINYQK